MDRAQDEIPVGARQPPRQLLLAALGVVGLEPEAHRDLPAEFLAQRLDLGHVAVELLLPHRELRVAPVGGQEVEGDVVGESDLAQPPLEGPAHEIARLPSGVPAAKSVHVVIGETQHGRDYAAGRPSRLHGIFTPCGEHRCMTNDLHVERCLCSEEPLHPERSVPVTGFSHALRGAGDVERYRFAYPLRGEVPLPVHLVFSASERAAEIKAADLKAYRVEGVRSACEARQRWIAWWQTKTRHPARPSLSIPRRTGRAPRPFPVAPASS